MAQPGRPEGRPANQPRKPKCVQCGHENEVTEDTCGACGFKLKRICPKCGTENRNRKYCKNADCAIDLTAPTTEASKISLVISTHVERGKGLIRIQAMDGGKPATNPVPTVCAVKRKNGKFYDLREVRCKGLGTAMFLSNPAVTVPPVAVESNVIVTNNQGLLVIDVDFIDKCVELEFSAEGSSEPAKTFHLEGPTRGLPAPRGGWFRSFIEGVKHSLRYHSR